jgi:hypothetical protein
LAKKDPLHATIEEFAAEGFTYVKANYPRCRVIRLRPVDQLPRISMGLTLDALARRLCGVRRPSAVSEAMASG